MKRNIFITGFSGTGKTTVGQEVACLLGWRFVDIDQEIIRVTGKSIEEIFGLGGEQQFRKLEQECLVEMCQGEGQVISTGGGIITDDINRRHMESNGAIICLEARPETIYSRLSRQTELERPAISRPMLEASDALDRIRSLKKERQFLYSLAGWTVHTDRLTPAKVASEVISGWNTINQRTANDNEGRNEDQAVIVRTAIGDYPVCVGWDIIDQLGEHVQQIKPSPKVVYIITDEGIHKEAHKAQSALEKTDIPAHIFILPSGEQNKTLENVGHVYKWLASRKAERGHLVLGMGGGVVGDLAGFVASTYLRGMPFAVVPTTLLAMMDASIGGKTAVDLPQGKNLVGAFYQPRFVLSDVSTLKTLPKRQLISGWAEAIKHGLILDQELLSIFEQDREPVQSLDREIATSLIRRSVAIKADVVSRDEKETLGIRVLLNYGHTIGHAIEAATGYGSFLHGEAVSVGMMGAAYIAEDMGMITEDMVDRQRAILEAYGLPVSFGNLDLGAIYDAMRSDKKMADGAINWVLLRGIGNAVTRNDVPLELVQKTLRRLAQ